MVVIIVIVALAAGVVMGFAIVFAALAFAFAALLFATFVFFTALVAVTAFFVAIIIIATAASGYATVGLDQFGDLAHGVLGEVELAHPRAANPPKILNLSQSAVVGVGMIGELRSWT